MPWIRVTADFDESFGTRRMMKRRSGSSVCVRRKVARQAIAAGNAEAIERPAHLRSTYSGKVRHVG